MIRIERQGDQVELVAKGTQQALLAEAALVAARVAATVAAEGEHMTASEALGLVTTAAREILPDIMAIDTPD